VGPARGADTTKPPLKEPVKLALASGATSSPKVVAPAAKMPINLAREQNCLACHVVEQKLVGPSFREVAARYKGKADAEARLAAKISQGGSGNWGAIPMPAQPQVGADDVKMLAKWILEGSK